MPFFKKSGSSAPTYSRLITHQDWEALRKNLATKKGQDGLRSEMSLLGVDGALHFACRFHPPIDVFMSVAEIFPGSITQADKAGRYPLHIAAKWGASPKVIRFLVEEKPDMAGIQDNAGKTPLHYVCESYSKNYFPSKNGDVPTKAALLEIVRGLCKASPSTVNLEDDEDMTALEYALDADVDLKAIRSIQKACEKDWKQRQTQSHGAGHEIAVKNLLEESQVNCERLSKELLDLTHAAMHKSMAELKSGEPLKLPGMVGQLPAIRPRKANSSRAFAA